MRSLVQRLKRVWHTPVEFYGVDRPEPQAGSWHGLLLFVLLLVVLGLLWLVRYLPERTVLVHAWPEAARGVTVARMSTEDIATVAAEAYEVVEGTRHHEGMQGFHFIEDTTAKGRFVRSSAYASTPSDRQRIPGETSPVFSLRHT
jgi:hypothetical protein